MPSPILIAIGSALLNKALNPQQQPQQQLDFNFPRRARLPRLPFDLHGTNPLPAEPLGSDPILAAMMDSVAPAPYASPEEETRVRGNAGNGSSFLGRAGNEFMSSLTNSLVQRLIFGGGGQQAPTYAPPRFR